MSALGAERTQYDYSVAARSQREVQTRREPVRKPAPKPRLNLVPVMVVFLVIFATLFGVLYMQGKIQANNIAISKLKSQISAVEEENAALELQIVMADDVNVIAKKIAEDPEYYGMRAPTQGQIVKVKLDAGAPVSANGAK